MKISVLRGSSMNQQVNRTGEISHQEKNAGHGFSRVGFLDLLLFVQTVSASKNKIKKKNSNNNIYSLAALVRNIISIVFTSKIKIHILVLLCKFSLYIFDLFCLRLLHFSSVFICRWSEKMWMNYNSQISLVTVFISSFDMQRCTQLTVTNTALQRGLFIRLLQPTCTFVL